jgi:hypothetical protein
MMRFVFHASLSVDRSKGAPLSYATLLFLFTCAAPVAPSLWQWSHTDNIRTTHNLEIQFGRAPSSPEFIKYLASTYTLCSLNVLFFGSLAEPTTTPTF